MSYKIFEHQKQAVVRAIKEGSLGLFMETGTGKTLVALELIDYYLGLDTSAKALVLCPLSIIVPAWIADIAKFKPQYSDTVLNLNSQRKQFREMVYRLRGKAIAKHPIKNPVKERILIANFETFRTLADEILYYQQLFDVIKVFVVDESSKIKDHRSKITKAALKFGRFVDHRFPMSGCPAPNTPLEFWGQGSLIEPAFLGTNFYSFRATYGVPGGWMNKVWYVPEDRRNKLLERLKRKAIFLSKEECLDLPPQVDEVRHIELPANAQKAYDELREHYVSLIGGDLAIARNVLAQIMRLRQVTSGHITVQQRQEGEDLPEDLEDLLKSVTARVEELHNEKQKELYEFISELPANEPVLVWGQFVYELEKTKAFLESHGLSVGLIYGKTPIEDRPGILEDFKAGKIRILLAHPRSLGHGVTLVNTRYAVYISLSYSLEDLKQSRDRIHRIGQTKKCTYVYILVPGSIDEIIYKALQKKQDVAEAILEQL